jgi:vacuolar protein sorting-associated protein 54
MTAFRTPLANLVALFQIDYDSASLAIPTNPMRGITQSTVKLHAVLHPVLSPPQMKDVMSRVFDMFTQKLPECFKPVQPRTAAGKKRCVLVLDLRCPCPLN